MTVERGWVEKGKARKRAKIMNMSTVKMDPVVGTMVKGRGKQGGGGRMPTRASPRPRESPMEAFKSDEIMHGNRKCKVYDSVVLGVQALGNGRTITSRF